MKVSDCAQTGPKSITSRNVKLGAMIFCVTLLAYLRVLSDDFIWNDSDYVTAPGLRSLDGLARIWTQVGATQQYYPLLHSAFWAQHQLFGDHPLGYHVVTLLLHASSAVLLALVLQRLFISERAPPACPLTNVYQRKNSPDHAVQQPVLPRRYAGAEWIAALLFALHPVHVESVAWITEQKNTLSLAFYLLATIAYLKFDETRRLRAYVLALALFVFSIWCKTVTATLPAALLLIFWWERGRLDWRRDVLPLLPWLAFGAAAGMFSSWVEQTYGGAMGAEFHLSVVGRVLVAGRAICFYACKLIWPFGLNFIYPRWAVDPTIWWQWLFPIGVLAVGVMLWLLRRHTRGPFAAFLFFVGSLFPVLGFVNLYGARYSWVWDHWQYLPDLGPLALAGVGLIMVWQQAAQRLRWLVTTLVAALTLLLGGLTWSHCAMFHDDETLYRTILARNPDCWMAHNNLGVIWAQNPGRQFDAIAEYKEAIRLKPDHAMAYFNLGVILEDIPGRLNEAIGDYEEAIRLKPDYVEAHNNLGNALVNIPGRLNEAIAQFEEALRLKPDFSEMHYDLGNALIAEGRVPEAIAHYEQAIRLKPDFAEAHNNLGNALNIEGRTPTATAQYEEAVRLKPDFIEARNNLGIALEKMPKHLNDAIAQFEKAIRLEPDYVEAHRNMGSVLTSDGWAPEATAQYEEVRRVKPDFAEVRYNLGNALIAEGRAPEAIAQFEEAIRLKPDYAEAHNNLGNALNAVGRGSEAAARYEEAIHLKPDFVEAHNNLAETYSKMPGRLHEAIAQYEEVLRVKPDFAEARYNMGNALKAAGQTHEAIAQYEKALNLKPDFAEAHNNLGSALNAEGRIPEATAQFEKAIFLKPDYFDAHNNLGNALLKMPGRLNEAIEQYGKAILLKPDFAAAHFNLAIALLKRPGGNVEARAQLEAVLRLQPDNERARRILGSLDSGFGTR